MENGRRASYLFRAINDRAVSLITDVTLTWPLILIIGIFLAIGLWGVERAGVRTFLSGFVSSVATALLVVFVIERPTRSHLTRVKGFSVKKFCSEIKISGKEIVIFDIWMKKLIEDEHNRERFIDAILQACRSDRLKVRILIAHPDSDCAKSRASELNAHASEFANQSPERILDRMRSIATDLYALQKQIQISSKQSYIQIRMFDVRHPGFGMYRIGNMTYWYEYPTDATMLETDPYKTTKDYGPYTALLKIFEEIYVSDTTITLEEYMIQRQAQPVRLN